MSYICSTLLQLFLISSKKLYTHMKPVIMFIENKQSQHFSSHTHKCLFLSPGLHTIPQYFHTSWVIICLLPLSSNFYQQKRKYLKFLSIHLGAPLSSYPTVQLLWLTIWTVLDKSIFLNQNANANYIKISYNATVGGKKLKKERKREAC